MDVISSGLIGIAGTVIGVVLSYCLEGKREASRERKRLIDLALNWDGEQRFRRADLGKAPLIGVELEDADLSYAYLRKAHLRKAVLRDANLEGAKLQEADLQRADLRGANLQDADLQKADLRGTVLGLKPFSGDAVLGGQTAVERAAANLKGANLRRAKVNSETVWPKGFQVPDTVQKMNRSPRLPVRRP